MDSLNRECVQALLGKCTKKSKEVFEDDYKNEVFILLTHDKSYDTDI